MKISNLKEIEPYFLNMYRQIGDQKIINDYYYQEDRSNESAFYDLENSLKLTAILLFLQI